MPARSFARAPADPPTHCGLGCAEGYAFTDDLRYLTPAYKEVPSFRPKWRRVSDERSTVTGLQVLLVPVCRARQALLGGKDSQGDFSDAQRGVRIFGKRSDCHQTIRIERQARLEDCSEGVLPG